MKISLNIEKRYAFMIVGLLVLGVGGFFVYGYGTTNPVAFGHSGGEVDVNIGATTKTLQQAINAGDLGGAQMVSSYFVSTTTGCTTLPCKDIQSIGIHDFCAISRNVFSGSGVGVEHTCDVATTSGNNWILEAIHNGPPASTNVICGAQCLDFN